MKGNGIHGLQNKGFSKWLYFGENLASNDWLTWLVFTPQLEQGQLLSFIRLRKPTV